VLANDKLIFALPKGRILRDVMSLVNKVGIEPEAAFEDGDDRRLRFATNDPNIVLFEFVASIWALFCPSVRRILESLVRTC